MWLFVGSFFVLIIIFAGGLTVKRKDMKTTSWQQKIFSPGVLFMQSIFKKQDEFFQEAMTKVLAVMWILHILVLVLIFTGYLTFGSKKVMELERDTYFGSEKKETLYVETEGMNSEVEVILSEQIYSQKEVDEFFKKAKQELPEIILGENKSLKEISDNLNLVSQIEGNPISIEWIGPEENVIQTQLTAILTLEEREERLTIPIAYKEEEKSQEQVVKEKILEEIKKIDKNSQTEKILKLPAEVDGKSVSWFQKSQGNMEGIVMFMGLIGVLIFWKEKEDKKRKRELIREKLILEYPELVSKMTLLLGAGMTLMRAWERIVKDYKSKREKNMIAIRYSYEEMILTYREIENGTSLKTALDHFGKRIGIPRYIKFSTLLIQNLKRGSTGLIERLEIEAVDAFEERKAIARQMGEKASTKLLFPMILMLIIVLVFLIVPAMFSLNL